MRHILESSEDSRKVRVIAWEKGDTRLSTDQARIVERYFGLREEALDNIRSAPIEPLGIIEFHPKASLAEACEMLNAWSGREQMQRVHGEIVGMKQRGTSPSANSAGGVPRILDVKLDWASFDPDRFRQVVCPICLHNDQRPRASIVINHVEFALVRCTGCTLLWRAPMPDPVHLTELYSERYYAVDPSRRGNDTPSDLELQVGIRDHSEADSTMRKQKCEEEVKRWLADATIHAPSKDGPRPRFLEIGGGRGYLQAAARKAGWETLGLEMSPFAIQAALAKGLSVLPVPVDVFGLKYVPYHRYFDLIAFFDFLEHVPDPARLLRVVRELLSDNGTIIFRAPIIGDDDLPSLHLIDHLWHFSSQTLKRLLDKEGFEVYRDHDSGRFTDPDGARVIQNWTFYARKSKRTG